MNNLVSLLLTPRDASVNFNNVPWLIVCGAAILIAFYYDREGRKRIPLIRDNRVWKQYVFDRLVQHLWIWGLVGAILTLLQSIDGSIFSLGIWLALWIAWGVGIAAYWVFVLIRRVPSWLVQFNREVERSKFMPTGNRRR